MKNSLKLFLLLICPVFLSAQDFFEPLGGPEGVSILSCFKDANGVLYVKTDSSVIYHKSHDDGDTWQPVVINDNTQAKRLYADATPNLFAIDSSGVLYRSDGNGEEWDVIYSPNAYLLNISPTNDLYLMAGSHLLLSQDKGNTWDSLHNNLSLGYDLGFHPQGDIYGYIKMEMSIFRSLGKSTDGGTTWEEVEIYAGQSIYPYGEGRKVYVSEEGVIIAKLDLGDPGMFVTHYISYDDGNSFHNLDTIASLFSNVVINDAGHIIHSDRARIRLSKDMGASWANITAGLPIPEYSYINNIFIDNEQYIYVCHKNNALYKSILPSDEITSIEESTNKLTTHQVYPNPFEGSFEIELDKKYLGTLTFQLINQQGELVKEGLFTGSRFRIKNNDLPAGIYFYRVVLDEKIVATGKVVAEKVTRQS